MRAKWLLPAVFLAPAAHAEVLATCSAADGYGYYIPARNVAPADAGWIKDGITGGRFQLVRDGAKWDIVYIDTSGERISSTDDGGIVSAVSTPDGYVVATVLYQKSFETWVFWLTLKEPVLTFSQAKFGSSVPKHSLMRASCRRGA